MKLKYLTIIAVIALNTNIALADMPSEPIDNSGYIFTVSGFTLLILGTVSVIAGIYGIKYLKSKKTQVNIINNKDK